MKETIELNVVRKRHQERCKINRLDLSQIIITDNGVPVEISAKVLQEFKYTGLSNNCFLEMEYWNKSKEDTT